MTFDRLGPPLRRKPALPDGANVSFVDVTGPDRLAMRTYERGVEGETLACGSGVVAAAIVAARHGLVAAPVVCATRSGVAFTVAFATAGGETIDGRGSDGRRPGDLQRRADTGGLAGMRENASRSDPPTRRRAPSKIVAVGTQLPRAREGARQRRRPRRSRCSF